MLYFNTNVGATLYRPVTVRGLERVWGIIQPIGARQSQSLPKIGHRIGQEQCPSDAPPASSFFTVLRFEYAQLRAPPAVIKTRLAAGADPKVQMKNGRMLLHLAAHNNENPAVIEALLDQTGQDATLN